MEKHKASSRKPREVQIPKEAEEDEYGFFHMPDGSFYDPDGYFFDKEGYDEFGGYYDDDWLYHPGPGNKHEFEGAEEDDEEDELIAQYNRGMKVEDHPYDND